MNYKFRTNKDLKEIHIFILFSKIKYRYINFILKKDKR